MYDSQKWNANMYDDNFFSIPLKYITFEDPTSYAAKCDLGLTVDAPRIKKPDLPRKEIAEANNWEEKQKINLKPRCISFAVIRSAKSHATSLLTQRRNLAIFRQKSQPIGFLDCFD